MENKITERKLIEYYLDELLNIPTDNSYELLKKLCNYYMLLNKEAALFYLNEYQEIWLDDDLKTLKKTRKNDN